MSLAKPLGNVSYLGSVSAQGFALFSTGTLPPEMFAKLSYAEVQAYERYWEFVEQTHKIKLDLESLKPKVDVSSGETYVLKCNLSSASGDDGTSDHPQLPYKLVRPSFGTDLWGFGLLLFYLCAGHPLFPVNSRTGELLSYADVCQWTEERAKECVYENIDDHTAQDLILRLLSPPEQREKETIESILCHPFFVGETGSSLSLSKRKIEASVHKRLLGSRMVELSEKKFLEERTQHVSCWDLDILERFHLSPSEIVKRLVPDQQWRQSALPIPSAMALLPYTVGATHDIDGVNEAFGLAYVRFSKAVYFATLMKRAIDSYSKLKWSSGDILKALGLSNAEFSDIQSSMSNLAAKHVELFRSDPMAVALKLVQQGIFDVFSYFDERSAYFYAVDEFHCAPVLDHETYPIETSGERTRGLLQNGIMFMHLSTLYARGVSKSLFGMAKLLGLTYIPKSWTEAAKGLLHTLDEKAFVTEIELLQLALSDMYSTKHRIAAADLNYLQHFLSETDPQREFAGLVRVLSCDMCLWTTAEGVKDIERLACNVSFRDVMEVVRKKS